MIAAPTPVEYHVGLKDLPVDSRPRERLLNDGPESLSPAELLAIILRTGTPQLNVLQVANSMLARHNGLEGLSQASVGELCSLAGLGPAKAIQVKAAFEIGRRLSQLQ